MSLLGWAVGLSIADRLLGDDEEREEEVRRETDALRRHNDANERRIGKLEDELRDLKRGGHRW